MLPQIKTIVTDIEGTTSDIDFVRHVLFPYAAERIGDFVQKHANDAGVGEQLTEVAREIGTSDLSAIILQLQQWIEQDVKATPLKQLQGMIWRDGYQQGVLQSPIYDDAYEWLQRWHARDLSLAVYSSGSVAAQQLFFQYNNRGDLRSWFQHWFDTTTGAKIVAESYRTIAQVLKLQPASVLFLTDLPSEAEAASAAGMQVLLLNRAGLVTGDQVCPVIESFAEVTDHVSI